MDSPRTGSPEPGTADAPFVRDGDGLVGDAPRVARPAFGSYPAITTGENVMPVRNRVQWGPIVAGLATALATFLLMTVLGIAVGASVLDPADTGEEIGTWAAVWGAVSAILAFFVGGWIAAKSAAVGGSFAGLLNGFLVGAAGLALILWLTGTGLGNLFGTIGADVGDIINVAEDASSGASVDSAAAAAEDLDSESTFDTVRDSAFGTFLGLLLPLVAAALGGWLGHNTRRELIEGTG